jgi:hypothetical protein
MKAIIPADAAQTLGLTVVGDQAIVSVLEVRPDGGVLVQNDNSPADAPMPMPAGALSPALAALPPPI